MISSHDSPDGDAIGSELGLRALLIDMGKTVTIVNSSPLPDNLTFLVGTDEVHTYPDGSDTAFDAFLAVDAGRRHRLHPVDELAGEGVPFINIDHHEGNDEYGTVNWCDASYGSTGEMIFDLARAAGTPVDLALAEPLYVALLTDTGRFSFGNTTPSAHRMAEALLEAGVDPAKIHRKIYRNKSIERLRLEARAIAGLQIAAEGAIAWCAVTAADLAGAGASRGEARDLIEIPESLDGVEVAMVFREDAGGGGTRVSLRSAGSFRVNSFAERYGGGGHPKAAGLLLAENLKDAQTRIVDDLTAALGRGAAPAGTSHDGEST